MPVSRFRAAIFSVFAALLATASSSRRRRRPPAARRPRRRSPPTASRSRCRSIPRSSVGTLPNGLRYYVRANGKPSRRAELRLVVKAGSVLEDDDQQGLAHFVEHMEFEGTEHFPGQSIVDFLSSLGLSIGADANAATSYDDTQYTLRVPTDVPGVLDRALLILEDWAQGAIVRSERHRPASAASSSSEWRMHLGAGERTQDKIRRAQLEGSRYADRPPIGKPDDHRARAARAAGAVLPRLVPAGSDGGHRRRRRRSRRRRGHDQGALLVADGAVARDGRGPSSTCRITPARATPSSPTRRRPRPPCRSATFGRRATRARSAAIATSCSTSCSPTCSAPGSTSSARARIRRFSGPAPIAGCSRRPGRGTRRCCRRWSRTTA